MITLEKIFVYFMKKKSEVITKFKIFKPFVENQTERKIKAVRSDNGREYVHTEFNNFFEENGIQRQLTVPHTPQQNGVAVRANRPIVEMARSWHGDGKLNLIEYMSTTSLLPVRI